MSHQIVLQNIDHTRRLASERQSVRHAAIVCGGEDREFLEDLFRRHSADVFNADGSTRTLVFEERLGNKARQGNFLGALLVYQKIKQAQIDVDPVMLVGMVFGRGERVSPFGQILGNRKALISVMSHRMDPLAPKPLTAIEEAMKYFSPLAVTLGRCGFRGLLCKWGDETQIPSVAFEDLLRRDFSFSDVIKCVACVPMTEETASQKDWVIFDPVDNRMITQCGRNRRDVLLKAIDQWRRRYPAAEAGVSLGPVAVSSRVMDLAEDIFADDIRADGVFLDFDPYVIQALGCVDNRAQWDARVKDDPGLQAVVRMIPEFYEKIFNLKRRFQERYGRPLVVETLDLGRDVYWADIGQHTAFAEKVFSVNEPDTPRGEIACRLEDIPCFSGIRDGRGNLLIDSVIAPGVDLFDSVVIGSVITGQGTIARSVIKNSLMHNAKINQGFVLNSARISVVMAQRSGLYEAWGARPVELAPGDRLGTLLSQEAGCDLRVSERTDFKNKAVNYEGIIFDNTLSFAKAFDIMRGIPIKTLQQRRQSLRSDVVEIVVDQLFNLFQSRIISEGDLNLALAVIAFSNVPV